MKTEEEINKEIDARLKRADKAKVGKLKDTCPSCGEQENISSNSEHDSCGLCGTRWNFAEEQKK